MNPFFYHCGSGASLYSGAWLLVACVVAGSFLRRSWFLAIVDIVAFFAAALVWLSSTPMIAGLGWLWVLVTLAWLAVEHGLPVPGKTRWGLRGAAAGVALLAMGLELPYRLAPSIPTRPHPRLYVIGDSISAGLGTENGQTWPRLFSKEHGVEVVDWSVGGATLSSIQQTVARGRLDGGAVLLEIGGNDMLGNAKADAFEADLERLVQMAEGGNRTLVMLELPLLPSHSDWGAAQRRVANKHGIILIPKRYFASMFVGDDATVDGIHLTPEKQHDMSRMMWDLLHPLFGK